MIPFLLLMGKDTELLESIILIIVIFSIDKIVALGIKLEREQSDI